MSETQDSGNQAWDIEIPAASALQPGAKLVAVGRDDLLHCLQVAVWRAGLIRRGPLRRLKGALRIGEDESVPKPPASHCDDF